MQRRRVLAALGAGVAGLAGCAAVPSPGTSNSTDTDRSPTDPPRTGTPTDSTPDGASRAVDLEGGPPGAASIVDLETVPRTYALSPLRYRDDDGGEVRMKFSRSATADHPATVVASLTNANAFVNTFRLDWLPPFGRFFSDVPREPGDRWSDDDYTYRVGLAFVPTENHDLIEAEAAPAVERDTDGQWRLATDPDKWLPERVRLDPGQVVRGEYALVGRPEGEGNGRPTGVYEFNRGQDRPVEVAVWDTAAPGPAATSRFAGVSVPPLPDAEASPVAWYHEADATTPSYVEPSVERTTLPAEVAFTFVNHDRRSAECGHWSLYKLHEGTWYHVGPWDHTADCRIVGPGGAKRWTLHAYRTEALRSQDVAVYDFLGGGRYAAIAGYGHATPRSAAVVELVGDPVRVVPTDDVEAEWDDRTVTVTASEWDDEEPSCATLRLTRADSADRTLIAEQVMRERYRGLRNLLAYVEDGVERDPEAVVLRTDERTAQRVVGHDAERTRFGFDGQTYEVRAE